MYKFIQNLIAKKNLNAITMVLEIGNIDKMVVASDYDDNTKAEFENKNQDFCNEFDYISDDEWLKKKMGHYPKSVLIVIILAIKNYLNCIIKMSFTYILLNL